MSNDRKCGNCCFGIKDQLGRANMRCCAISKKREVHTDSTTASELNCKHHLFKAVGNDKHNC